MRKERVACGVRASHGWFGEGVIREGEGEGENRFYRSLFGAVRVRTNESGEQPHGEIIGRGMGGGGASAPYHTPRDVRILLTCEHAQAHLEGRPRKVREIRGKVREMEDLPLGSLRSAIQTWRTSKQTGWKKWCGSQLLVVGGSASGLDTLLEAMEGRPAPAAPPRDDTEQDRLAPSMNEQTNDNNPQHNRPATNHTSSTAHFVRCARSMMVRESRTIGLCGCVASRLGSLNRGTPSRQNCGLHFYSSAEIRPISEQLNSELDSWSPTRKNTATAGAAGQQLSLNRQ